MNQSIFRKTAPTGESPSHRREASADEPSSPVSAIVSIANRNGAFALQRPSMSSPLKQMEGRGTRRAIDTPPLPPSPPSPPPPSTSCYNNDVKKIGYIYINIINRFNHPHWNNNYHCYQQQQQQQQQQKMITWRYQLSNGEFTMLHTSASGYSPEPGDS